MRQLRVLVPLDESDASVQALQVLENLAAGAHSCAVELLHVVPPGNDAAERQAHARDFLAKQAAALNLANLETTLRVFEGDASEIILQRACEEHFDFICMSTRSSTVGDQPGSVAARIMRESTVPVVVFPTTSAIQRAA